MTTALIVEDDASALHALDAWARGSSISTILAGSLREARRGMGQGAVDLALIDLVLPDGSGFELADEIELSTRLVFMSGLTMPPKSNGGRERSFLRKPLDLGRLEALLQGAGSPAEASPDRSGTFIGSSQPMRAFYEELQRFARVDGTVFLCGETGVGKELAARQVHKHSSRSKLRFEAVNCGALAPSLVESELFGHERGSFTGAHKRHLGVFERAKGGTVFLDEITEMPLELQVKLLRVLESGTVRRVGGSEDIQVDVRLVVATNREPARAVAEGFLREDLFYRLYVLPIVVPPLRDRGADILELAEGFLAEWAALHGDAKALTDEARARLLGHDWPGNVRELRNTVYRAFHISREQIGPEDVLLMPRSSTRGAPAAAASRDTYPVGLSIRELERRYLLATLESCKGDKKATAQVLGVSLKTVYNKLASYRAGQRDPNGQQGD